MPCWLARDEHIKKDAKTQGDFALYRRENTAGTHPPPRATAFRGANMGLVSHLQLVHLGALQLQGWADKAMTWPPYTKARACKH